MRFFAAAESSHVPLDSPARGNATMSVDAPELPQATKLALDRTRLAYERTLMAWVRTSTSLISFGFSIYKFFDYLRESQPVPPPSGTLTTRHFALLMIGIGIVALVLATIEHRRNLEALRREYGKVPYSVATLLAVLMSLFGVAGLLAVFFRK
jgi:putative membrane protein